MRSLTLTTLVLSAAIALTANSAMASPTQRTELAPVVASKAEPQVAFGFGFYTCVHTMYMYGQRTYGRRVNDNILFQAAYETCAANF